MMLILASKLLSLLISALLGVRIYIRWTANPTVPLISHQDQNVTSSSALELVFKTFQNCFTATSFSDFSGPSSQYGNQEFTLPQTKTSYPVALYQQASPVLLENPYLLLAAAMFLGVTFVYLYKRTSHRFVRCVCRSSIGLFQSIKRTSNLLWQGIKAVTNAVMPTRQDMMCTDIHQQTDALTLHSNTTHNSSTCSYNTASTSIRSLSSEHLTASSPNCSSPSLNDVLLSDGCGSSPSCGSPIARSSSSHSVEYSRGQFILGGSFNLEVLEKLGEGGFGTVYKVLGRDTIYAAKLSTYLNSEYVHEEFETLLDLSHPNIVHVLEKLPKGYLMEFCSNDLSNLIKASGPIKGETCCDISLGIARAVSYIHLQYLAHLDIKPENILLTESGSPKLADFGSATYFRKLDGTRRLLDQSTGTFGYAPPEMLDFKPPIHMARMDSWCLGATFFQMLTGRRAFSGETKEELLGNQLSSKFDLPKGRCHKDQFSCDYMALIRKLCTVNPKLRISPGEAKRRLKEYKLFMLLNTWDRDEYHC